MGNTWYVYLLCDPDTEEPFYVGKGKGERMHSHEQTLNNRGDGNIAKKEAIRRILAQGKQVLKKQVAEFDDEREAYVYEASLIKHYGAQLTNIKPGGGRLYPDQTPKPRIERAKHAHDTDIYTEDDPYMPIRQVPSYLGWSEEQLRYAMARLNIKRHKFRLNPIAWIARDDIVRLKQFKTIRSRHHTTSS